MKDYLVINKYNSYYMYVVSAKDSKDAISQVYEKYNNDIHKEDLVARSLGSLHNENGKIIRIKC